MSLWDISLDLLTFLVQKLSLSFMLLQLRVFEGLRKMFSSRALKLCPSVARSFGSTSGETLVKTAYYDMHLAMGGKMVPFAGYELPVQVSV